MLPIFKRVQGAIPSMHVHNHLEDCQVRWALKYIKHTGETYGEGIESSWAEQNQSAGSTKEQNDGHRHDSLDGYFGYWNWVKLQRLGKSGAHVEQWELTIAVPYTLRQYSIHQKRLSSLRSRHATFSESMDSNLIDKWRLEAKKCDGSDTDHMKMYKAITKTSMSNLMTGPANSHCPPHRTTQQGRCLSYSIGRKQEREFIGRRSTG